MSASAAWVSWNVAIAATRTACATLARATDSSSARAASPQAAAPTLVRKKSSVPSARRIPSPSSPSRFAAGTRHCSNRSSAIGCGADISCRRAIVSPGVSASTTNALMARFGPSAVRANTMKKEAMVAFEMNTLVPSRT